MTNTGILGDGPSVEKPTLGRYQVEKELGKGAMDFVSLGKNPKIGRVVAIKAIAVGQKDDADELGDVMPRFFGEAQAEGDLPAGILSVNPAVSAGIVAFLDRAMDKQPANRFQTGEESPATVREAAAGAAQPAYESADKRGRHPTLSP